MLLANGLQGTLVPVRANYEGFSATAISFMGAAYFAGFVAAACSCPRLIHRVGPYSRLRRFGRADRHRSCLGHSLIVTPLVWGVFRAGIGFCAAGMFAVLEGWLNQQTPQRHPRPHLHDVCGVQQSGAARRSISVHAGRSARRFSVLDLRDPDDAVPDPGRRDDAEPSRCARASRALRLVRLYRLSPVGVIGAIAVGLTSGAFWTLAPVYAEARGMGGDGVALFMSLVILGGALAQWPLGRFSDFTDRAPGDRHRSGGGGVRGSHAGAHRAVRHRRADLAARRRHALWRDGLSDRLADERASERPRAPGRNDGVRLEQSVRLRHGGGDRPDRGRGRHQLSAA